MLWRILLLLLRCEEAGYFPNSACAERLIQPQDETRAAGPEWKHTVNTWNYTCFDNVF